MGSVRFSFSFWNNNPKPPSPHSSRPFSPFAVAVGLTAGAATAFTVLTSSNPNPLKPIPLFGSITMADNSLPATQSNNGSSFPSSILTDSLNLLGIGFRRKSIFGLKTIDIYAFGVYADNNDIKNYLAEKYGAVSASELKGNKELTEDLLENDISMTIRLQIVYGKLSIRSVRNAFEESVGTRLKKYGGSDNKELLQRFTSMFKDDIKIPSGSVIHLSREKGHVLRTSIDGQEVGSIQSKVLCKSILDLYVGEDPFDKKAKEDIVLNLASHLQN
ncbi:hypothetical protein TanjilG_06423 [Lupinus angustifolius]|uniref:Chalcone isomerase domain-containing protein n=1 Tax=Lupinus angustifolius TaxID=3871 RepID=A0A1J7HWY1_LUPAN|nr:PREDICTED: fatty-acid-binding protein 1 [Lupinus angustifolius]OIW05011.1 hypothetical protein TanjilG_06423 [Lupinus angustifolius]